MRTKKSVRFEGHTVVSIGDDRTSSPSSQASTPSPILTSPVLESVEPQVDTIVVKPPSRPPSPQEIPSEQEDERRHDATAQEPSTGTQQQATGVEGSGLSTIETEEEGNDEGRSKPLPPSQRPNPARQGSASSRRSLHSILKRRQPQLAEESRPPTVPQDLWQAGVSEEIYRDAFIAVDPFQSLPHQSSTSLNSVRQEAEAWSIPVPYMAPYEDTHFPYSYSAPAREDDSSTVLSGYTPTSTFMRSYPRFGTSPFGYSESMSTLPDRQRRWEREEGQSPTGTQPEEGRDGTYPATHHTTIDVEEGAMHTITPLPHPAEVVEGRANMASPTSSTTSWSDSEKEHEPSISFHELAKRERIGAHPLAGSDALLPLITASMDPPQFFAFDILRTYVLRQTYLYVFLGLPALYYNRVAAVFDDANIDIVRMKRLVLEHASFDRQGIPDSTIPLAYQKMTDTWEQLIDTLLKEWKTVNLVSVLLLSAIVSLLQIEAAGGDPVVRYTALYSLICALISLLLGCLYIVRFNTMRKPHKAVAWAQEVQKENPGLFWNVWILLALPAFWLIWSLILYVICIVAFLWRGDPENKPTPFTREESIAARSIISCVLALAIIYGAIVVKTFVYFGAPMDSRFKKQVKLWIQRSQDDRKPRKKGLTLHHGAEGSQQTLTTIWGEHWERSSASTKAGPRADIPFPRSPSPGPFSPNESEADKNTRPGPSPLISNLKRSSMTIDPDEYVDNHSKQVRFEGVQSPSITSSHPSATISVEPLQPHSNNATEAWVRHIQEQNSGFGAPYIPYESFPPTPIERGQFFHPPYYESGYDHALPYQVEPKHPVTTRSTGPTRSILRRNTQPFIPAEPGWVSDGPVAPNHPPHVEYPPDPSYTEGARIDDRRAPTSDTPPFPGHSDFSPQKRHSLAKIVTTQKDDLNRSTTTRREGRLTRPLSTSTSEYASLQGSRMQTESFISWGGIVEDADYPVEHHGKQYSTAIHLLEAMKYLESFPDTAERIRLCSNVGEVLEVSKQWSHHCRDDWDQISAEKLEETIYLKFTQHPDLREELINSHPRPIMCNDLDYVLQIFNACGKAMDRVRERLMNGTDGGVNKYQTLL
ncbi:hypothetical protein FA15DRAFT_664591 [Coprinopsis marcescibilis]|uniref:NADAR domain-containing protein n=1 Tax=Coprinopsis marcescibilis TaxID=230819 RepID=A0A5C3L814_COPMA|nr:hypothetical protein FA15DRAFT_664591 [Coprinopsis marcescibilis]